MLADRRGPVLASRLARAVAAAAVAPGDAPPPARTAEAVLRAVGTVIGNDGGALLLMDPQTALFTTGAVDRLPAATCHPFFGFEVDSESPRTFRRRAATGAGAVAVSHAGADVAGDGYAATVLRPHGFADELRVVCRDAGASWGGISLWRRGDAAPFTSDEVFALDAAAPAIGAVLRDAVLRPAADTGSGTRHVVVLDGDGVAEASERTASDLLELADPGLEEFRHLDHLRALARRDPRFSTVIRLADGRWLAAHATPLGPGPGPGRVAVVLTSATPADLFGVVVAGAGLTPREVEVTRLLCRGHSDSEIATLLHISPHTAHDHVRSIRRKLGVRSRAEVAAKVFAEHYFDDFLASAAVTHG